jgi:hypothetical protein
MRIKVSDPFYTSDLLLFLRNSGMHVLREPEEGTLAVIGVSTDAVQEVLTLWNGLHEGVTARIVG